jgi:hypothetical protein
MRKELGPLLVRPLPAEFPQRLRWFTELDQSVAEAAIRSCEAISDQTDDMEVIHNMALGLACYLSLRIHRAVEMGCDVWAATA